MNTEDLKSYTIERISNGYLVEYYRENREAGIIEEVCMYFNNKDAAMAYLMEMVQ